MTLDSPYKGLVPFEDTDVDALLFFGRERESAIIEENVLAARLTVLYGPSGVGKTSVLRAGVAHRLRARARRNVEERGHPEFVVVVFSAWSEDDPVRSLRAAVRGELAAQFGSALLEEREGESLAETLGRWTDALACDLLLVLDQAEEYFEYHRADSGFAAELPGLVTRPQLRVRVLLSLRDDALAKLDRFKGEIPNLFANYLRLDHLDGRSARDAITKPVEQYNELTGESVEIEPELVEAVLEQTAAGRVELSAAGVAGAASVGGRDRIEAAYLQLVLERIWSEERAQGSDLLRAQTLARLGGAEAIVRANLRRAVEELSTEEKDLAADMFRHLVTPSGAKIAHSAGDLAEYASVDETRVLPVLTTLGRERIVRTVDGAGENGARYEIYHDVLGAAILAWRREQELARERREAERRHRRLAAVAIGALLALAAMTAVAIYALSQRSDARTSARRAQSSEGSAHARELAALAQSELATDPLRAVQNALQAAKDEPSASAEDVLRSALIQSRVRKILHAGAGPVNAAVYSPNGSRVVTADADGTARVFRVRDGKQIALLRHRRSVTDAAFSADGRFIATASQDKTARLWTASGRLLRTFPHGGAVLAVALAPHTLVTVANDETVHMWSLSGARSSRVFRDAPADRIVLSVDGRRAAAVGGDSFARVYNVDPAYLIAALPHGSSRVLSASFTPSGEALATGAADWLGRVWALPTLNLAYELEGHEGQVVDVAVSPHGRYIATASLDGIAAVWDANSVPRGRLVATLIGHTNFVNDVSFSPDGLYVVTSSRDGTARVWKTAHGNLQALLAGHQGPVRGASFSPTGANVLTYSEDGTARIWDAGSTPELQPIDGPHGPATTLDLTKTLALTASGDGTARIWKLGGHGSIPLRHHARVNDAAFSPDGLRVVTASDDRTAGIWTTSGTRLRRLPHPAPVRTASFSPDSRFVATGAADGRVRVWNARSGGLVELLDQRSAVDRVAFSPDGKLLAVAGRDGVVGVWDTGTWHQERRVHAHHKPIIALSFSPDSKSLLTGSKDQTARIWSIGSRRVLTLKGHRAPLTSARFSPDGKLVATASVDHDVRLWDAQTGNLVPPVLRGHLAIVSDARFSDDGRWLVSAGPGTAGLWQVRTHQLVALLRGRPFGARGPTGRGSIGILHAAGFAPGGFRIVTAGADGGVRTYLCAVCAGVSGLEDLAAARLAQVNGQQ